MNSIAYYDVPIDAAMELFGNLRDSLPGINTAVKPFAAALAAIGRRNRHRVPGALRTLDTAPARRQVKLYGPEIVLRADGSHAETGASLWGIGIQLDGNWHVACIDRDGRATQIMPTHWQNLPKAKVAA